VWLVYHGSDLISLCVVLSGDSPISDTCKPLTFKWGISAAELDSRTLSTAGLTHQWSCELETLRGENSYSRKKDSKWGETHNGESSQPGVCVSRLIEGNNRGTNTC